MANANTDASLLQFHAFWKDKQPPDSSVYLSLYQERPELAGAVDEYRLRNKAMLDFVHDLITYQSDTVNVGIKTKNRPVV